MNGPDLFFIDVETTGLSSNKQRVLEVCYARVPEPDGWGAATLKTFRFRATPQALRDAHPRALAVNGYRADHEDWLKWPVMGSDEARVLWEDVLNASRGATITNQNAHFDRGFVWSEFFHHRLYGVRTEVEAEELAQSAPTEEESAKFRPPWERRHVDVQTYSRAFAKKFGSSRWALEVVYDLLGGPKLPPHRAAADVLRAMWVYGAGQQRFEKEDYPVEKLAQDAVRRLIGAGAAEALEPGSQEGRVVIPTTRTVAKSTTLAAFAPGSYPKADD